jgi:hypothetical protein
VHFEAESDEEHDEDRHGVPERDRTENPYEHEADQRDA